MTTSKSTWPVPTRCPFCGGGTVIERVRCDGCASAVEGRFTTGWVQQLSPEQLAFVRVFIACRGKIKDVEQALGLSYPTVVARLREVPGSILLEVHNGGAPIASNVLPRIFQPMQRGAPGMDAA
ncbi:DUF2089 domain-containing protein, partial [Corallococcus exiguus]|uniref:DUF2089 domain-containing protein n=1 Tax=Corallococcus exiguus TaxID=83462 RepID=UPI001120962B